MGGPGDSENNWLIWKDVAKAMNDQAVIQCKLLITLQAELIQEVLGHGRVVFQRHVADGVIDIKITHGADKTGSSAIMSGLQLL